jgi:hypothetical protein
MEALRPTIGMCKVARSSRSLVRARIAGARWRRWLALAAALLPAISARGVVSIEIDLKAQRAYLLRNHHVVRNSPISSGRAGFRTPSGHFKVIEKDRTHTSSIYGKIVDRHGRTLVADADIDMRRPPGSRFVRAPMHYFLRFDGPNGLHAGYLPGYPASHGCVRLPREAAIAFYNAVDVGSPVTVFRSTGARRDRHPTEHWRTREPFFLERIFNGHPARFWPFGG